MTNSSSMPRRPAGEGRRSGARSTPPGAATAAAGLRSTRMLLHSSTHSLQMYTPGGPAMRFCTWRRSLAQKVQRSSVPRLSLCFMRRSGGSVPPSAGLAAARILRRMDDLVHQPVFHGFLRVHLVVAIRVLLDFLQGLAAVARDEVVERALELEDLVGLDADVRGRDQIGRASCRERAWMAG